MTDFHFPALPGPKEQHFQRERQYPVPLGILNRIDETIVFHMLSKEHLKQIVDIQLKDLANRLKDRQITLEFTEKAIELIMEEGFDPSYGARPLRRAIQRRLENPLASQLLAGQFTDGDVVRIDGDNYRFVFKKPDNENPVSDDKKEATQP